MTDEQKLAVDELNNTDYSLIIVKNNNVQYRSKEESVSSIVSLMDNEPDLLKDSIVADKIIGRAVAMVCDHASVKYCYGSIISEGAVDIFNRNNLPFNFNQKVKAIRNRDNTDLCPIEKLTQNTNDSREGIKKIKEFLNKE